MTKLIFYVNIAFVMSKKVKSYMVSSANWEFEVDDIDSESAALSGLIMAMNKFDEKLLVSTVVMCNPKHGHELGSPSFADFYSSESMFGRLGFEKISNNLREFVDTKNEFKHIRK